MSPSALAAPPLAAVALTSGQRRTVLMASSLLLDYPGAENRSRFGVIRQSIADLPLPVRSDINDFLDAADGMSQHELESHFTAIFDQKRKCCPYLSYYAAGDTRRRGMALVRFIEAYRAAGWEVNDGELPDYLPTVLEFCARSDSPIALELLTSHRDGLEVLRAALTTFGSPYASVLNAVCRSLPEIDAATLERYRSLINEGPPTELVGITFLGALAPYSASPDSAERGRA